MREWNKRNLRAVRARRKQYLEQNHEKKLEYAEKKKSLVQRWRATPSGKVSTRKEYLKRVFGLSLSAYTDMAVRQGGACAICKQPESSKDRSGNIRPLAVDHDHQTGAIRGLLCDDCNIAIGRLKDSPSLARALAKYLEGASEVVPLKIIGGV